MANKVTLIGRLGADPEVKAFTNGDRVANLRVATSERWKDKQTGEKKERTEWHAVAIFGPLVDVVEKFTKKGDQIYLEGALKTRKWEDKDGNDRYTTEVVLQGPRATLELLGGNGGGGNGNGQSGGGSSSGNDWGRDRGGSQPGGDGGNGGPQNRRSFADDLDDDIPFVTCVSDW